MAQNALQVVSDTPASEDDSPKGKKTAGPTKALPTDRITFERQLDLLRAYAAVYQQTSKPVTNNDVAGVANMKASTAALANKFFTETHLLQRVPDGFVPAAEVMAFLTAKTWNAETAGHKLASILAETWFAKVLMSRLALAPLEERRAVEALADESGATAEYEGNLRTLISYLEVAGLVQRDGTLLRAARTGATSAPTTTDSTPAPQPDTQNGAKGAVATSFVNPTAGVVQFHVNVKVDMAEFGGWSADRINAFFGGIAQVLAAKADVEKGASQE
ncbi:MAG TPA: hypothetical protein VGR71_06155 [Nitrospira sp.]|nr:hypothetical protein [Nitrospira sp.]